MEERKVDFLQQIEFWEANTNIKRKEERKRKRKATRIGGFQREEKEGVTSKKKVILRENKVENSEDFLGEHRETEKEQLQPRLSKYVSRSSWNSYPYSISSCVRFWIFNVILIGVDGKGHKLFCLYWLLTYVVLNLFVIFPTSLSPLKDHEMWLYLIFISCVCSPFVSSILYYTCFCFSSYPSHGHQLFIWGWLQGLGM